MEKQTLFVKKEKTNKNITIHFGKTNKMNSRIGKRLG